MICTAEIYRAGDGTKDVDTYWSAKEVEHLLFYLFDKSSKDQRPLVAQVTMGSTGRRFWLVARNNRAAWGHTTIQRCRTKQELAAVLRSEPNYGAAA